MHVVFGREGGVDGHMDGTHESQCHIHEVPLGAVVRDGDYAVARLYAEFHKAIGHEVGVFVIVVRAVSDPFAVDFAGEEVVLRMVYDDVVQEVEQTCDFDLHD